MKKPIGVFVADAHCHPHKQFDSIDITGRSTRVMHTIDALEQSLDRARELHVPWVSLGDLLHTKSHVAVEVIDPLLQLFGAYADIDKFLLVGNHERPDRFSLANTLEWLGDASTHVMNTVEAKEWAGVQFVFFPYMNRTMDAITHLTYLVGHLALTYPTTPRVLLGHGCVDGATADNGSRLSNPHLTPELLWTTSFNSVLFGDIHKRQQIGANGRYIGALIPQNFGERSNPPGYAILWDDFTVTHEAVDSPSWVYRDEVDAVTGVVERPDAPPEFQRPSPQAVQAATAKVQPPLAVEMDVTDLRSMVEAYAAVNEIPQPWTVENVVAAIQECMS